MVHQHISNYQHYAWGTTFLYEYISIIWVNYTWAWIMANFAILITLKCTNMCIYIYIHVCNLASLKIISFSKTKCPFWRSLCPFYTLSHIIFSRSKGIWNKIKVHYPPLRGEFLCMFVIDPQIYFIKSCYKWLNVTTAFAMHEDQLKIFRKQKNAYKLLRPI